MKKITLIILSLVVVVGAAFLFLNQNISNQKVSIEQRIYIAPSVYTNLNTISGDISVRFAQDRLTVDKGDETFESYENVKVPQWTVLEEKDSYTNFWLARISIVPSNKKYLYQEQEESGYFDDYQILNQDTVINEKSLTKEMVAQKTLEQRTDLMVKIEVPYIDEPSSEIKFRTADEARVFLEEIIRGLKYDELLLASAADRFAELESNIFRLFGGLDPDDAEEVKNWPPELMTAILFSELQQVPLDSVAQRTFKDEGTVSGFCDKLYEGANEASEIIPQTLTCVSTDKDILLLVTLDEDAQYCLDSRGFKGLVKSGSVSKNATACQQ